MATPQNEIRNNASAFTSTVLEMSQLCLSSLERLSALNLNAMRQALDESMVTADRVSQSGGDPTAVAQPQDMKPLLERSMSYSQNVMEICASTQEEMMRLMNSRMGEFKLITPLPQGWSTAMDAFTRSAQQMATMGADSVLSAARTTEQTAERTKERVSERSGHSSGGKSSHRAA